MTLCHNTRSCKLKRICGFCNVVLRKYLVNKDGTEIYLQESMSWVCVRVVIYLFINFLGFTACKSELTVRWPTLT